jgi:Mg-chelatase subunit ChlD
VTGPAEPGGLADAVVLLVGTGDHRRGSGLRPVPAVRTSIDDLRWALIARCGVDPGAIISIDPANPFEFGEAIADAVETAAGPLVFYFVGHGLVSRRGALHLATRETRVGRDHTALAYDTVREYLRDSGSPVRLVVLDCCFSGRAVDVLGSVDDPAPATDIDGVYVLTSAGRDELALAPEGARHTVFTGALITLLTEGDPAGKDRITLDSAVDYLERRMLAASYPRPRYTRTGRVGELFLTDNAARSPVPLPAPALVESAARRSRGGWFAALAGAALAAPVLAATAQQTLRWTPAGARGWLPEPAWRRALLIVVTAALAVWAARWITERTADRITRWAASSTMPWQPRGIGRWSLLRRATGRLMRPVRRRFSWRRTLSLALPLAIALVLGTGALELAGAGRVLLAGCLPAAQITVLTTPDSFEPVLRLRDAFLRADRRDFGCPVSRVHVTAAPAAQAAALIRGRWSDEARLAVGPSPDMWLPDSSVQVAPLADLAEIARVRSIATSPIVLATPDAGLDAARAVESLPGTGDSARRLYDGARAVGRSVVAPAPTASVAGELARVAIYQDDPSGAPAVEEQLDRARSDARFPADADVATLLCRYDTLRQPVALLVPEQAAVRFNRGDSISPDCGPARVRTDTRLRLSYPDRTAVLDHPLVRLSWPDRSDGQRAAADRFDAWLGSAGGHLALADIGLRPPGFAGGGALTIDHGALPGAPYQRLDPDADAGLRQRIVDTYRAALRPGRVLLALDASGSMGTRAGDLRRWDAATRAAADGVALMGPADELGVWVFQGNTVNRLVPVGRRDGLADVVGSALGRVVVAGRTPMYDAVSAAAAEVGPSTDDVVTAVVVLTDGEDDNASSLSADRYRREVGERAAQVWVVAIGAATCAATALRVLPAATGGRCVETHGDAPGAALADVLRAVWRG